MNPSNPKRWRPAVMLAMLAVLAAACGGGETAPDSSTETDDTPTGTDATTETIRLAAPAPLTGPATAYGTSYIDGLQLAVDRVNAEGGIDALGGAQLELMVADDEGNPERGVELIRQMVDDGAIAAVAPLLSSSLLPALPVFDELQIPVIAPGMDTVLSEQGSEYFFRIVDRAEAHGRDTADFIAQHIESGAVEIDSVGMVSMDVPPGTSVEAVLVEEFDGMGLQTTSLTFDAGEIRDFGPIVSQLREADVDLVTGHIGPGQVSLFVDAITLQDWRPSEGFLFVSGGFVINQSLEAIGPQIGNWMTTNFMAPVSTIEVGDTLAEEHRSSTGQEFDALSGVGPGIIGAIAAALEEVEEPTGTALRDALKSLEYPVGENMLLSPGGLKFNDVGDNEAWVAPITQYDADEQAMIAVWPEDIAVREPRWPALAEE